MLATIYTQRVDAVNMISVNMMRKHLSMETMGARLRDARTRAGFGSARSAAMRFNWTVSTYAAHENGQNKFGEEEARTYAKAFKKSGITAGWLLTGEGELTNQPVTDPGTVPLVGYVSAGATTYRFPTGDGTEWERVKAPDDATPNTVAVEIRGDSLGPLFDRWLVYYDDVRRPVTTDLINRLCVVGLPDDGGIFVKKLRQSRASKRLFHLEGQFGENMLDVPVEWAAPVKHIMPR